MITKISKLKDLGVFRDFIWKSELPEFKKFNLIYGWNRSGKTTLSRIFESCEKRCIFDNEKFKRYPDGGEFEIKTNDNVTINNTDVNGNSLLIKVFNQDFIEENISFDPSDSCKPIVYVGEEDIESKKQLEKLRTGKVLLGKQYEDSKKDKTAKEEIKTVFLKGLGVSISNVVFDKTYNRTKAENRINEIGVDNFTDKILSDDDKQKYEEISRGKAVAEQSFLENLEIKFSLNGDNITNFDKISSAIKSLLQKKVIAETIERLKDNPNINAWVKEGYDLHKSKQEKEKCLFCQNNLTEDLFDSLSKHFSKDYENLQSTINTLISETEKLRQAKLDSNNELFPDLKENYKTKISEFNNIVEDLNRWIDAATSKLKEKYNNPLIEVSNLEIPEEYFESLNSIIGTLNAIITNHNIKVKNHSTEVKGAREKLELHTIAIALSEQDYKKIEKDLADAQTAEISARSAVENNNSEIVKLEQKSSNTGKAIGEINKHLKDFFGKEEIKLELASDKKGYIIKRDGESATNLSEGEKTAIAFSYFIVKVAEKDFKIKDGIIFIDDPISSFDSNFIYHCFSLINNNFKEAGQLFISTHNFQLFNLVKDWFIRNNNNRKNDGKEEWCGFYMVENYFDSNLRKAKIVELDKTLRNYKSEYHFLFSLLYKFKDTEPAYADFYTIGNVARRFFDIFADFKIPDSRDQKQKMEAIIKELNEGGEKISDIDGNKVYKLINEFSHNSDPTSAIEHKDKSESKDAIAILLKIIEESDPKHYKILKSNIPVEEMAGLSTSELPESTEVKVTA